MVEDGRVVVAGAPPVPQMTRQALGVPGAGGGEVRHPVQVPLPRLVGTRCREVSAHSQIFSEYFSRTEELLF